MPSGYSLRGKEEGDLLPESVVRCVSFSKDILGWLGSIREISSERMKPMIDQYIGAIKDFVDSDDEGYKMELTDSILQNSDSFRASLEISNTISYAKAELMKKLFSEFEEQMKPILNKYALEEETRSEWFKYTYQADETFYSHSESTYPGINYVLKSVDLGDDLSLWLRIEIDNKLFGSLCVFDYAAKSQTGYEIGNQCDDISDELWEKLDKYVILPDKKDKGWIILWKYLPTGSDSNTDGMDKVPDFKRMNEAAIELADKDKRVALVSKSIRAIEDTLLNHII